MNKAELIAQITQKVDISKSQASATIDAITTAISKALIKGDKVTIVDFGTFSVIERLERNGRNPKTGEPLRVKSRKVAKFKAGKELSVVIASQA